MTSRIIKNYQFHNLLGTPPALGSVTLDLEPWISGGLAPFTYLWTFDCLGTTSTDKYPSVVYTTHGTFMTDNISEAMATSTWRSYNFNDPSINLFEIVDGKLLRRYGGARDIGKYYEKLAGGTRINPSACEGYYPTPVESTVPVGSSSVGSSCELLSVGPYCLPICSGSEHDCVNGATTFEFGLFGSVQLDGTNPGTDIDLVLSGPYRLTDGTDTIHTALSYFYLDLGIPATTWGAPGGHPTLGGSSVVLPYSKSYIYFNNCPRFYLLKGEWLIENYFTSATNKWFYEFDATISINNSLSSTFNNVTGNKDTTDPYDILGYEGGGAAPITAQRVAWNAGTGACVSVNLSSKRLRPNERSFVDIDIIDNDGTCLKDGMKIWISPIMYVGAGAPDPAVDLNNINMTTINYSSLLDPHMNILPNDAAPIITTGGNLTTSEYSFGHPILPPATPIGTPAWTTSDNLGVNFSITADADAATTITCRLNLDIQNNMDGIRYVLVRITNCDACDGGEDAGKIELGEDGGASKGCSNYIVFLGWSDETSYFNEFGHRAVIRYYDPSDPTNIDANNLSLIASTLNSYLVVDITDTNVETLEATITYDRGYGGIPPGLQLLNTSIDGKFFAYEHPVRDTTMIWIPWIESGAAELETTYRHYNVIDGITYPEFSCLNNDMPYFMVYGTPPTYTNEAAPSFTEYIQSNPSDPIINSDTEEELLCITGWPLLEFYSTPLGSTTDPCVGFFIWNLAVGECCWGSSSDSDDGSSVSVPATFFGYTTKLGTIYQSLPMLIGEYSVLSTEWIPPWLGVFIREGTYIPTTALTDYTTGFTYQYYSLCNIGLSVTDDMGTVKTDTTQVALLYDITSAQINLSAADYTFEDRNIYFVGSNITFTATTNNPLPAAIITYAWDFGDTTTSAANPATHTYTAQGNYLVTVVATDNNGNTWSTTHIVEIRDPFKVSVNPSTTKIMPNTIGDFSILAYHNIPMDISNPPYTYTFSLASGTTVDSENVEYYHKSRCYSMFVNSDPTGVDFCYKDVDETLVLQTMHDNRFKRSTVTYGINDGTEFISDMVYISLADDYNYDNSLLLGKMIFESNDEEALILANNTNDLSTGYAEVYLDRYVSVSTTDTFYIKIERIFGSNQGVYAVGYNHMYLDQPSISPPEDYLVVSCVDADGFALEPSDPLTIKWL